jgi:YVTN family beta-propeller protein
MGPRFVRLACAAGGAAALSIPGAVTAGAATAGQHTEAVAKAGPVTVYVTHLNGPSSTLFPLMDTVTPIRGTTAGTAITVGDEPSAVAITPNGKTVYAVNPGQLSFSFSTVTPITVASNKARTPITVGYEARAIAITPNGRSAYVVNYWSSTVSVIAVAGDKVTATIDAGGYPWAIAISP